MTSAQHNTILQGLLTAADAVRNKDYKTAFETLDFTYFIMRRNVPSANIPAAPPQRPASESLGLIKLAVENHFGVPVPMKVTGSYRIALPRHVAVWLALELVPIPVSQISDYFNYVRKSAYTGSRRVRDDMSIDPKFNAEMLALKDSVKAFINSNLPFKQPQPTRSHAAH